MDYLQIFDEIINLQNQHKLLLKDLKNQKIFSSSSSLYLKDSKEEFMIFWFRYIIFFEKLKKLLKKTNFRQYLIFFDYNKLALKKFLVYFYYKVISDLYEVFGKNKKYIINLLSENFKNDYKFYANYIYNPKFIYVYNIPIVFILAFKNNIRPEIKNLLYTINKFYTSRRIFINHDNLYCYVSNNLFKVLTFILKVVGISLSRIKFTRRKKGFITLDNLEKYLKIGKPGDIFLTRLNRGFINVTIPGFWKHMAMFLGTGKYIKEKFHLYDVKYLQDSQNYIIEARRDGVSIVNIKNFAFRADYLGVFRTKFKQEKIDRAIKNTLKNVGKSYDFILNFYSDNRFVCTALIMKAYAKEFENDVGIDVNLKKLAFSLTYPPNNFVKEYSEGSTNTKTEVEGIFFIDSHEKTGKNFVSTIDELKNSYKRSRLTFFLK